MKKLVSFLLALLLCMSVLVGLCYAADSEPDPEPTPVAMVDPYSPEVPLDTLNGLPEEENTDIRE